MIIKLTNAVDPHKGNALLINSRHVLTVFESDNFAHIEISPYSIFHSNRLIKQWTTFSPFEHDSGRLKSFGRLSIYDWYILISL